MERSRHPLHWGTDRGKGYPEHLKRAVAEGQQQEQQAEHAVKGKWAIIDSGWNKRLADKAKEERCQLAHILLNDKQIEKMS